MSRRSPLMLVLLHLMPLSLLCAQESVFDVTLLLNTESADRTIELYEGLAGRPQTIADLRGSQIALATTALLSGRQIDQATLERSLEAAKFNQNLDDDVFRMKDARANVAVIKELLQEMRRRNFAQKVVSTVEQLFPPDTHIGSTLPIYVVAFGHQNIDSFVRRTLWMGRTPEFVGEGQGELTIVVNLAKAVYYGRDVDERFNGLMSVVAHEVFHAAFGVYRDKSARWRQFLTTHRTWLDQLLDLTQNEGIAYYLTLVQRSRGRFREDQLPNVRTAFEEFNRRTAELQGPSITDRQALQILQQSNTSGYWGSFGSMTGMVIARQIDQTLGRQALSETIALGPYDFFAKYVELMKTRDDIPRLSDDILRYLGRVR
jgi:hypothetical protein